MPVAPPPAPPITTLAEVQRKLEGHPNSLVHLNIRPDCVGSIAQRMNRTQGYMLTSVGGNMFGRWDGVAPPLSGRSPIPEAKEDRKGMPFPENWPLEFCLEIFDPLAGQWRYPGKWSWAAQEFLRKAWEAEAADRVVHGRHQLANNLAALKASLPDEGEAGEAATGEEAE